MKLLPREKLMLSILLIVVVLGSVIAFWVYPNLDAWSLNKTTLQNVTQQKLEAERLITLTAVNKKEIAKLKEQSEKLYSLMRETMGYDVSLFISDMLKRNALTPISLDISNYERAEVPREVLETVAGDKPVPAQDPNLPYQPVLSDYATRRTATLSFSGSRANANRFFDQIVAYNKSLLLGGCTIETGENGNVYELRLTMYEFAAPEQPELDVNKVNQNMSLPGGSK